MQERRGSHLILPRSCLNDGVHIRYDYRELFCLDLPENKLNWVKEIDAHRILGVYEPLFFVEGIGKVSAADLQTDKEEWTSPDASEVSFGLTSPPIYEDIDY